MKIQDAGRLKNLGSEASQSLTRPNRVLPAKADRGQDLFQRVTVGGSGRGSLRWPWLATAGERAYAAVANRGL